MTAFDVILLAICIPMFAFSLFVTVISLIVLCRAQSFGLRSKVRLRIPVPLILSTSGILFVVYRVYG